MQDNNFVREMVNVFLRFLLKETTGYNRNWVVDNDDESLSLAKDQF